MTQEVCHICKTDDNRMLGWDTTGRVHEDCKKIDNIKGNITALIIGFLMGASILFAYIFLRP